MRALVTGAGGFLGRCLVSRLARDGIEVWSTGTKIGGATHVQLVDPLAMEAWCDAVRRSRPDLVFHLAGTNQGSNVEELFRVNVVFGDLLLSALKVAPISPRRIVFIGTAAEYGEVRDVDLPITEQTPTSPCSLYGASKLAQTILAQRAANDGLPTMIVRPFNMLGPHMPTSSALGGFAEQLSEIAQGRRLPVLQTGDSDRWRDFVHVDDAADCLLRLAVADAPAGIVVNLCTGRPLAVRSIVEEMIRLLHVAVEVRTNAGRRNASDPRVSVGSPALITRLLGASPPPPSSEQISGLLKLRPAAI